MRPIPAPRIGDAHGLLRAISERDRLRLDEFVTEFSVDELFPPGLENALGRTRQFISFARAAGLVKEDRGVVELTEIGKRYVKAADSERFFDVSGGQAEWLRRQLREKHMTDSIYHGAAIGLSLLASSPPDFRVGTLDFGRALAYLARAGWDNDNTFQSQGERYAWFLQDLELIDGNWRLSQTGEQMRAELTLPIHMSLKDLAGQLNPGGVEAAVAEGESEWRERDAAAVAPAVAAAEAPTAPPVSEQDEYEEFGAEPGTPPVAAPQAPPPAPEPVAQAPAPPSPPQVPADLWDTATPDEVTRSYGTVSPEQAAAAATGAAPGPAEPQAGAPGAPPAPQAPPEPQAGAPGAPPAPRRRRPRRKARRPPRRPRRVLRPRRKARRPPRRVLRARRPGSKARRDATHRGRRPVPTAAPRRRSTRCAARPKPPPACPRPRRRSGRCRKGRRPPRCGLRARPRRRRPRRGARTRGSSTRRALARRARRPGCGCRAPSTPPPWPRWRRAGTWC